MNKIKYIAMDDTDIRHYLPKARILTPKTAQSFKVKIDQRKDSPSPTFTTTNASPKFV